MALNTKMQALQEEIQNKTVPPISTVSAVPTVPTVPAIPAAPINHAAPTKKPGKKRGRKPGKSNARLDLLKWLLDNGHGLDNNLSYINRLLQNDRNLSIDTLMSELPDGLVSRSTIATFRRELLDGKYSDIINSSVKNS